MIRIIALTATVMASQVLAECPSGPLGPQGLKLTRTEPFMEVIYRPSPEGVVESRRQMRDGEMQTKTTIYSHPLMVGKQISANGELILNYDQNVHDLAKLDASKKWTSKVSLLIGNDVVDTGNAGAEFKALESVSIGACQYKVWVVEDYLELKQSGKMIYVHYYAPDLGVVLQVLSLDENSKPVSMVAFDKIEIP